MKRRWTELTMMTVRFAGYPLVLFAVLSPGIAATFLGVQMAVTGMYLGPRSRPATSGCPCHPRIAGSISCAGRC